MSRRAAALLAVAVVACSGQTRAPATVRITIPPGATVRSAADSLAAHDVIRDRAVFQFYARLTGRNRALRAGTFQLPRGASYRELLEYLTTGRAIAYERLVIPEGLMLSEVAETVALELHIPAESVLVAARDSSLRAQLGVPTPTLEGYLYPSTYYVPAGANAHDVVRQMVAEFESRWHSEWTARADSLGMTRHDVVTLASIIEGEVRYPADRPYVSSVYHNRLRRGMRLQADPTVIYALGRRRRLFERDYQRASRYNTYLHDGLPPGPINQPAAPSIHAALYPARTDFLYLVARADGQHVFSRTLREHLRAVADTRRER